jgi:thioredoxin reductase
MEDDGWGNALRSNDRLTKSAPRVVFAAGVRDELPNVAGIQKRWGTSVFICPYCDDYEFGERLIAVLGNHAMSIHQAMLLPDWGPTTFFTQGQFEPDEQQLAQFQKRNVRIEHTPVTELLGPGKAV